MAGTMRTTGLTATAAGRRTGCCSSSAYPEYKKEDEMKRWVAFFVLGLISAGAAAQAPFPGKTVRFISGVTPGSASDTMARILAERLQAKWGQPVIVENRL